MTILNLLAFTFHMKNGEMLTGMRNANEKIIFFITGASGVGKTTLLDELAKKYKDMPWSYFHFDSIGVPSLADMRDEFGTPSRWQEVKTNEWIDKLVNECHDEKIFFEGQVNLQFILDAFQKHNFENYKIILLDCTEKEMGERLADKRAQPELFNDDMKNWLGFLRNQARELGAKVIDTTNLSPDDLVEQFEEAVAL